jgi:hypothetical protein
MPALVATDVIGTIVWLGVVADRNARLASEPVATLRATFAGPAGEAHGGLTRPSDSRVLDQYPRGTEIRNTRQFSILSEDELRGVSADMGLDRLDPALIGATMVVSGIPDFSHIPPSSRLQGEGGTTLTVDMQNRPCNLPGRQIDESHPGFGAMFKSAAKGRRGVTAWVEREGTFRLGERLRLHIPDQRPWTGPDTARS